MWGCTQEAGARRLHSPAHAGKQAAPFDAYPGQQEFCVAQNLTERHARAVLRLPTEELRSKALKAAAQRGYTVQQTEAMV